MFRVLIKELEGEICMLRKGLEGLEREIQGKEGMRKRMRIDVNKLVRYT